MWGLRGLGGELERLGKRLLFFFPALGWEMEQKEETVAASPPARLPACPPAHMFFFSYMGLWAECSPLSQVQKQAVARTKVKLEQ